MSRFKKGLLVGIVIGVTSTTLVSKMDVNALFNNKSTANYASSFLYRYFNPSYNGSLIETPILEAVVDDIEWNFTIDENSGTYFYEGVFENWTDVDIDLVELELNILSSDNILLDSNYIYLDDIKSKEKALAKIKLPNSYADYIKTTDKLRIEVVGKSRDFKNKPFSK